MNKFDSWPVVKLADVAEMSLGKMLDAKKNKGQLQPYLRNPNVQWFGVDLIDVRAMPFEEHEEGRFGLQDGDVLVCEGGQAGRAAVWDGRVPGMKFQKAIHRVRCGPQLNNRYLVHRLMLDYFSGRLADYYTGATIKHLTGQDLARYQLALPPVSEQLRIVAILDKADALRAKRRAGLAKLDVLTQSLFLEMFGSPVTNPKGWPIGVVGEMLESAEYGTSVKSSSVGQFPVLRMNNILHTGEIDLTQLKFMDLADREHERYLVRKDDVLFNRTNSVDLVGKTAIYRDSTPMAYAGYLIRLRIKAPHSPEYLAAFMNSAYSKRVLRGMCKSIIGMANINATELKRIPVMMPPADVQESFGKRMMQIVAMRSRHLRSLAHLDSLFFSLQFGAFRGELTA